MLPIDEIKQLLDKYDKNELAQDEKLQSKLIEKITKIASKHGIDIDELIGLIGDEIVALDNEQLALKICANAIYGTHGDKTSRFYNPFVGEAITSIGAHLSKTVQDFINDELKIPVLYGDTDSVYLRLDEFIPNEIKDDVEKTRTFIYDFIKKKLYPHVEKFINENVERWFGIKEHRFEFKQEIIARRGLFLKGKHGGDAKKRYVLYIIDKEGALKDELYIVGIDIKRSEYPKVIKERLMGFLEKLMKHNELDTTMLLELKADVIKWCNEKILENISLNHGFSKNLDEYKQYTYAEYGAMLYNDVIAESFSLPKIVKGTKAMVIFVKEFKFTDKLNGWNEFIRKYRNKLSAVVFPHDVVPRLPKWIHELYTIDEQKTVDMLVISPTRNILNTLNIDPDKLFSEISVNSLFA